MAGIGFELKKLYKKKGLLMGLRAFFYSFIVTVGPMILCIALIISMQSFMESMGIGYLKRQIFTAIIQYCFVFSLLISGGAGMYLSRFFADMMFIKSNEEIIHGLDVAIFICVAIGSMISIPFISMADMELYPSFLSYILFMTLIVIWTYSIIISAIKNYKRIFNMYFIGMGFGLILMVISIFFNIKDQFHYLAVLDAAFLVIAVLMIAYVRKIFASDTPLSLKSVEYVDHYGKLIGLGFFMNAGVYAQNMVFWASHDATVVQNVFRIAPFYDVPMFYSFLTAIPAMVLFIVMFETNFYDNYKNFYGVVISGGDLAEMESSKFKMVQSLYQEFAGVMEFQFFFTLIFLLTGRNILPGLGLSSASVDIFSILTLACYIYSGVYVSIMTLLYFDELKGAYFASLIFFISSGLFTYLFTLLGDNYRGLGFFIAALVTFIFAYRRLRYFLRNIDYFTYCNQPLLRATYEGFFTKIVRLLTRRKNESYKQT